MTKTTTRKLMLVAKAAVKIAALAATPACVPGAQRGTERT
jgi:hypothetical protein